MLMRVLEKSQSKMGKLKKYMYATNQLLHIPILTSEL